ncbi:hypothetical protein EC396_10040 [Lutibacter sp. HS1-25]|uniref:peptidoglycan DD-metalloendopeptidase family protein n=1 Tax=Lutibacter sp. HS1-25 TaxID=2485000 RepID=UPI001010E459|nr:peptidoglycan DD-metalloendopeptidase family protein [Lutibacter sp. HS1-25]RXP53629.1 hypothetical protein EC396_10040 [Lutibacter sp. HS1-25]
MKKSINYLIALLSIALICKTSYAQNNNITIEITRHDDKSVDLTYKKLLPGSYYLELELNDLTNCNSGDFKGVINNYTGVLLRLKPNNDKQHINFSYSYRYMIGVPNPNIDSSFTYILPFKNGKKFKIGESSHVGEKYLGHERPINWKSYSLNSKNPDTVCSMRKGIVVKIIDDFENNETKGTFFTNKTNEILIEHADGTYARYINLKHKSMFVKLGQTVYPQTALGIMNEYGAENYRLSFQIYSYYYTNFKEKDKQLKENESSLKFIAPKFITQNGIVNIKSGQEYMAGFNETVMFKEFRKSEQKKYKKDPTLFN